MGWTIEEFTLGLDKATYIDISGIDGELKSYIDDRIAQICYGNTSFSKSKAKKYIREFISTGDIDRKNGAISEFFLHIYLNHVNLEQECLFKNLEERSPKKGFDGVYKDSSDEIWYMESKSGAMNSCTHKDKIEEAYRDLKAKFTGNIPNDPWFNAYTHAKMVDASRSILDMFREYSDDFDNHVSHDLNDFNIIPCGTVVVNDGTTYAASDVIRNVYSYFTGKQRKSLLIICVTQRAIDEFEEYLNETD